MTDRGGGRWGTPDRPGAPDKPGAPDSWGAGPGLLGPGEAVLQAFEDDAGGKSATGAHREEGELLVGALELVQRRDDETGAVEPTGWPIARAPPLTLIFSSRDVVHALPRQHDRGEGLVALEQVDVVDGHAGLLEHLAGRVDRAVQVVVGVASRR